jgi:hypothetical protein
MSNIAGISGINEGVTKNGNKTDTSYKPSTMQGKYIIDQFMYPTNLQSDEFGGNKVIFYINIQEDSKFATQGNDFIDSSIQKELDITRIRGTLIGQNWSEAGLITSAIAPGIAQSAFAGAMLLKNSVMTGDVSAISKLFGKGGVVGAAAGTVALGIGGYAISNIAASATRKQKRLKTAIALHTPNNLQIRYSTNWESEDTATGTMVGQLADTLTGGGSQSLPSKSEPAIGSTIAANLAFSKMPNAGMVSAATGLAANPRKEQVFKGVDFRTFSFDYQFFPKSSTEAENVENIIKMFKFHMHPEIKDVNSYIYLYPSEFDIVYYKDSSENMHIHRHTSCVLVDMVVNYTPNGNFSTFANGMPTQINITLQFKELALMDKDMIANGL